MDKNQRIILIKMVKYINSELRKAQEDAVNANYASNPVWVREKAHERALHLMTELKKVRKLIEETIS